MLQNFLLPNRYQQIPRSPRVSEPSNRSNFFFFGRDPKRNLEREEKRLKGKGLKDPPFGDTDRRKGAESNSKEAFPSQNPQQKERERERERERARV